MTLIVRLESHEAELPASVHPTGEIAVDMRLTVGRAADNDLVLEDPKRNISKYHCVIESEEGQYRLSDLSRNGTYLNADPQPIPRDRPLVLDTGDRIRVGCFDLVVVAAGERSPVREMPSVPEADEVPEKAAERSFLGAVDGRPAERVEATGSLYRHSAPTFLDGDDSLGPFWADDVARPTTRHAFADHVETVDSVFVQPGSFTEAIPDDWDIAAELGAPSSRIADQPPVEAIHPEPPPPPANDAGVAKEKEGGAVALPAEREALLKAFLDGCGLGERDLGTVDPLLMMARAGRMLRLAVANLHAILSVRSSTKQDFGVERTMIGRSGNNPLKFIPDPDDAMRALLIHTLPGFLVAEEAVEGAFRDIEEHQAAMLGAMRAALETICHRLSPAEIENGAGASSLLHKALPPLHRAACWDTYRTTFDDVAAGLDNDAARIFGAEFAHGYRQGAVNMRPSSPSGSETHGGGNLRPRESGSLRHGR